MFRYISMFIFKLLGWKVIDKRPKAAGSAVYEGSAIYLVVPHSSNWDFFLGIMVRSVARIHANYLAKKSLFDGPFGWFYRALGGYPVDRSKNTNLTDQVVAYFKTVPRFSIAITPEGTRTKVEEWKTGFWRIAKEANVPLILSSFDYGRKEVTLSEPWSVGDDMQQDIAKLMDYFKPYKGKNH
ncbi:MAG: 1-acyl-sn-glycerol-3-phosphate acyltransferase [Flavobacteriales bacterium]|jgi:1-acyl-sn-glycerol-3-phosphate acyltransferase|nr:1-acyl-sn-glycerol-3-phosphate acyltransferase [Flavobacteriales bacterium]MBP9161264.1 1-acyl-sn-glycerol-3-phosphate acyltransferase [Flavobacteriales bacterium]MCI1754231.1 1-acyl-sn-glycerol-3-phosphate acyltransferase [Flavobacteriales bacterium]